MKFSQRSAILRNGIFGAAVLLSLGAAPQAFASWILEIHNNLNQQLNFNEIVNRQDIQIESEPPNTVDAHATGSFKVKIGDSDKPKHLKVQYFVGESGSATTVEFGFDKGNCFAETNSGEIKASYTDCQSSGVAPTKFYFSE